MIYQLIMKTTNYTFKTSYKSWINHSLIKSLQLDHYKLDLLCSQCLHILTDAMRLNCLHTMYHDVHGVCKHWFNASHSCSPEQRQLSFIQKWKRPSAFQSLTSVFLLHVHHEQGQVAVVGGQQGFDPALLAGLVLGSKLVRSQSWLGPHQREGELLLGLTQLDGAALQNNHSCQVPVSRPVLVEQKVPLEHEPALLIGSLYLTLWDIICGLLTVRNLFTQFTWWNKQLNRKLNAFYDITDVQAPKQEVQFSIQVSLCFKIQNITLFWAQR